MGIIEYDEKTGKPILIDPRIFKIGFRSSLGFLERYYRGLEEGKVFGTVCLRCGYKQYPPRSYCVKCRSKDVDFYELPKTGKLLTFTEVRVKPQTHSHYPDYIVGVVEVDGVKVVGHVDAKFEDIRPEQEVKIEVERREGDEYPRIVFKPVG